MKRASAKNTFIIATLFSTFIIPFVLAWLAYSHGFLLNQHTVNNGQLLVPPLNITNLNLSAFPDQSTTKSAFMGKWWLLNICPQNNDACQKNLYYIRQIRQATGKNRDRVNRGLVLLEKNALTGNFQQQLDSEYQGTQYLLTSKNNYATFLAKQNFKALALSQPSIYLVDPHGNIILFYSKNIEAKKILKDLEKLLRVSQIG